MWPSGPFRWNSTTLLEGQWCVVVAAVLQLVATCIQIMVQAPEKEEEEAVEESAPDEEAALLGQYIDAKKKLRGTKKEHERTKKARDALKAKNAKAKADAERAN